MVRAFNRIILVLIITSGIYSFYVHNDIDEQVPYVDETILTVAIVLGIFMLLKIFSKWQTMIYIKKREHRILYNYNVGSDLKRRIMLYELLDILIYASVGVTHILFPYPGETLGFILLGAAFEGCIYLSANRKKFRIGITNKVIILATNRPNVIRISRLKAIINKQGNYDFQYRDGRTYQIEKPWVSSNSRPLFNEVISSLSREKEIFCDDFSASPNQT